MQLLVGTGYFAAIGCFLELPHFAAWNFFASTERGADSGRPAVAASDEETGTFAKVLSVSTPDGEDQVPLWILEFRISQVQSLPDFPQKLCGHELSGSRALGFCKFQLCGFRRKVEFG